MILYLDTSALVKLYVREAGDARIRTLKDRAEATATSVTAYAESRAAFARLLREGNTTPADHVRRVTTLNHDWERFVRVELAPEIARNAGELAETSALRGFDAIHLASALWLADRLARPVTFAAFDRRLLAAATHSGLVTFPESVSR